MTSRLHSDDYHERSNYYECRAVFTTIIRRRWKFIASRTSERSNQQCESTHAGRFNSILLHNSFSTDDDEPPRQLLFFTFALTLGIFTTEGEK